MSYHEDDYDQQNADYICAVEHMLKLLDEVNEIFKNIRLSDDKLDVTLGDEKVKIVWRKSNYEKILEQMLQ